MSYLSLWDYIKFLSFQSKVACNFSNKCPRKFYRALILPKDRRHWELLTSCGIMDLQNESFCSLTKSSFSGSYRVLAEFLKAALRISPTLVRPHPRLRPDQKGHIGSLMRTWFPQLKYHTEFPSNSPWFPQPKYLTKVS